MTHEGSAQTVAGWVCATCLARSGRLSDASALHGSNSHAFKHREHLVLLLRDGRSDLTVTWFEDNEQVLNGT